MRLEAIANTHDLHDHIKEFAQCDVLINGGDFMIPAGELR